MKLFKLLFLGLFTFSAVLVSAQSDDNLIDNYSFDVSAKEGKEIKIKEAGAIEQAKGWSSPGVVKADLYTKDNKFENMSVPMNQHGREEAEEGCCYAGFMAYSYKEKLPRTYLQTKLLSPMVKDEYYCVSFNISLSDLSKYAVNGIGASLSKTPLTQDQIAKHKAKVQVLHREEKVMDDQYYWEDVCALIKSEGGEQYITIGNFEKQDSIQFLKMKKSRQFTQPQTFDAYYYIENVSIIPTTKEQGCTCKSMQKKLEKKVSATYKKTESGNLDENPELAIEQMKVMFNPKSKILSTKTKQDLDKIAKILVDRSEVKLNIMGHTDRLEQKIMDKVKTDLALKRADAVRLYLISKGVTKDRLLSVSLKDSKSTYSKDPKVQKTFMKVTFGLPK